MTTVVAATKRRKSNLSPEEETDRGVGAGGELGDRLRGEPDQQQLVDHAGLAHDVQDRLQQRAGQDSCGQTASQSTLHHLILQNTQSGSEFFKQNYKFRVFTLSRTGITLSARVSR